MAELQFRRLNIGWNAEPNAPQPELVRKDHNLLLNFVMNSWRFPIFKEEDKGSLLFRTVSKYRLGGTNDEGWYGGKCRYSALAPEWGQFYELIGTDAQRDAPNDWCIVGGAAVSRHFLFYLRDNTFEAIAEDWMFAPEPHNALLRLSNGERS